MSNIIVNPIGSSLEQDFEFNLNTRCQLGAIYPYVLMVDNPAGTFTVSLIKSGNTLFSKSFTSADIKTALDTTDNYAHVFYPIIPDNPVQIERGAYKLRITTSGGYVENEFKYLGWIQQFEDIQNEITYTVDNDQQRSLSFRIKVHREGIE